MGRRTQSRLDLQAGMFEAALALFERQGYDETSVEDICAAAGVGRATFFRYFETKAGLLREHNRQLADAARARLDALPVPGAVAGLVAVADAIHDAWVDAGPGLRRLGAEVTTLADPSGKRTHPELLDVVTELVRAGVASGELTVDVPPPLAAYVAVTTLASAVGWWFEHPDQDLRRLLDRCLELHLHGVTACGRESGGAGAPGRPDRLS